jgi:uncharacterized membrane-anchored protein YhcB (DUF1043 family)
MDKPMNITTENLDKLLPYTWIVRGGFYGNPMSTISNVELIPSAAAKAAAIADIEANTKALREENERLTKELKKHNDDMPFLHRVLSEAVDRGLHACNQRDKAQNQVDSLINALTASEQKNEGYRNTIMELEKQVPELKDTIERQRKSFIEHNANSADIVKDLRDKLASYQKAIKTLEDGIHNLNLQVMTMGSENERLKSEPHKITTKEAVDHISKEIQKDSEYRIGWLSNIAMQFKDKAERFKCGSGKVFVMSPEELHDLANEAAEGFLDLLCKDVLKRLPRVGDVVWTMRKSYPKEKAILCEVTKVYPTSFEVYEFGLRRDFDGVNITWFWERP